jgi:S-adenosylmethionine:tRNA ribosyltransferase-isomerase
VEVPDYQLPEDAVAQTPLARRDDARMLVDVSPGDPPTHRHVRDLPELVGPGDVVVINTSRVLPARLTLVKGSGGRAEVLLLEAEEGGTWTALVKPGRRLPPGTVLYRGHLAVVEVGERLDSEGTRRVRLLEQPGAPSVLDTAGTVPLPPYIHRPLEDPERYQTVYAERPGSVAAPTAGLHLTDVVLEGIRGAGAAIHEVDLAVGLGTFRPVTAATAEGHTMHAERYTVPETTIAACQRARRVVAVGTTTLRALEAAASSGRLEGRTDLFIRGDYPFAVVDVLLTNFHLPRSTLLLLLEAFTGSRWRQLYGVALKEGYRFLSFGDAMLVGRRA